MRQSDEPYNLVLGQWRRVGRTHEIPFVASSQLGPIQTEHQPQPPKEAGSQRKMQILKCVGLSRSVCAST